MNLTKEQREAIEWLDRLCTPSHYLSRLGPARDLLKALLDAPTPEDAGIGVVRTLYDEFANDDPNRPHAYTEGALDALDTAEQRMLAAAPTPEDAPSTAQGNNDPLHDFQEGQWWVVELDEWAKGATLDQRRAVAVVHHLLRSIAAAKPASVDAQPAITEDEWQLLVSASEHLRGGCDAPNKSEIAFRIASKIDALRKRLYEAIAQPSNAQPASGVDAKLNSRPRPWPWFFEVKSERVIDKLSVQGRSHKDAFDELVEYSRSASMEIERLREISLMPDDGGKFEWPSLPSMPASMPLVVGHEYFTAHQMQGYANAYGEAVRAAIAQRAKEQS